MITCEIVVEEVWPGMVQIAVIPKPTDATPPEGRIWAQLQEVISEKLNEIFKTADNGGSINGGMEIEPLVRARMEAIRKSQGGA